MAQDEGTKPRPEERATAARGEGDPQNARTVASACAPTPLSRTHSFRPTPARRRKCLTSLTSTHPRLRLRRTRARRSGADIRDASRSGGRAGIGHGGMGGGRPRWGCRPRSPDWVATLTSKERQFLTLTNVRRHDGYEERIDKSSVTHRGFIITKFLLINLIPHAANYLNGQ